MNRFALVLVHYPVLDREGHVVTTAITNLDLHDMARSARTYGAEALYVVHPITAQRELAQRIQDHWVTGSGKKRIPDRGHALEVIRIVPSLDDVYRALGGPMGRSAIQLWTTAASKSKHGPTTSYRDARVQLHTDESKPILLTFGTGWGLAHELLESAEVRLEPISAAHETGFNHLSVRAATAITLDRLLG